MFRFRGHSKRFLDRKAVRLSSTTCRSASCLSYRTVQRSWKRFWRYQQSLRECFNSVRQWLCSASTARKPSTRGSFEAVHALSSRLNSGVKADEAIFDKISMSAFEGTPLAMALRDCGLISFMICGIATEIGIDPTVRHGADLGLIPIVI